MNVCVNKKENTIEWNVGEKSIIIHNNHILYAFKHGKSMLMVKEKYELSEVGFSTYDKDGILVFSYKYLGSSIIFKGKDINNINGAIISADYEEEKRKLVVLKEVEEKSSLLIYIMKRVIL